MQSLIAREIATSSFMDENDTKAEFLRVSSLLQKKGVNLREVYPPSLTRVLGGSGSRATVLFMGEDSFSDPKLFLTKVNRMFGSGTTVLLNEIIDRANELLRSKS
jgi:hypothetical protein